MTSRTASCRCGAVTVRCEGEPIRVSVCHCRNCQRRSGSVFAAQARWPAEQVAISGETLSWNQIGESGQGMRSHFCAVCGSNVYYTNENLPGQIAVPVGTFADRDFPPPQFSVWEVRKHPWVELTGDIEHYD